MRALGRRGISLVEMVVAAILLVPLLYLFVSAFGTLTKGSDELTMLAKKEAELSQLFLSVLETGRLAQACFKSDYSGDGVPDLKCYVNIDPEKPGLLIVGWRFDAATSNVLFEHCLYSDPSQCEKETLGTTRLYATKQTYPNITEFSLCDENDFMGVAGCSIKPTDISKAYRYARLIAGSTASGFFRFRVKSAATGSASSSGGRVPGLNGAFFVRNTATDVPASLTRLRYQWGVTDGG